MRKGLVLSIIAGGVAGIACYLVNKKKTEEVKEQPVQEEVVDEETEEEAEEVSPLKKKVKKVLRSIKRYAAKVADWIVNNQQYLEAAGVVFSLVTSINDFRKSVKPATPISLSKKQVEDVVRTTFDGYLDTRAGMLKDDLRTEGVQEFLDSIALNGGRIMKNSITGDVIECRLATKGAAA